MSLPGRNGVLLVFTVKILVLGGLMTGVVGLTEREGNGLQPDVFTCSAVSVVSVSDCVLFQRMAQNSRLTHVVRQSVGLHPRCKALGEPNGNHLSKRCTTKLIHSELLQRGHSCWTLHV